MLLILRIAVIAGAGKGISLAVVTGLAEVGYAFLLASRACDNRWTC